MITTERLPGLSRLNPEQAQQTGCTRAPFPELLRDLRPWLSEVSPNWLRCPQSQATHPQQLFWDD